MVLHLLRLWIRCRLKSPIGKRSGAGFPNAPNNAAHVGCRAGGGMKITVQITVKSDDGKREVLQEVARFERGPLRPDTLGLSLAEARAILAGLEQTLVEQQAAEFIAQARRCPRC
jgi:hypothetical protein